jgi:hypothetical protein
VTTTSSVPVVFAHQSDVRRNQPNSVHFSSFTDVRYLSIEQCKLVGGSMNLSEPCPDKSDQSCQISCKDPRQANVCVRLTSLLVDGSPCGMCLSGSWCLVEFADMAFFLLGYGGTCISGRCQSAGFIETAKVSVLGMRSTTSEPTFLSSPTRLGMCPTSRSPFP